LPWPGWAEKRRHENQRNQGGDHEKGAEFSGDGVGNPLRRAGMHLQKAPDKQPGVDGGDGLPGHEPAFAPAEKPPAQGPRGRVGQP